MESVVLIYDPKSVPPSYFLPSFTLPLFPYPSLPFLFHSLLPLFFVHFTLLSPSLPSHLFSSPLFLFLSSINNISRRKRMIHSLSISSMNFIFNPTKRTSITFVLNVSTLDSSHPSLHVLELLSY